MQSLPLVRATVNSAVSGYASRDDAVAGGVEPCEPTVETLVSDRFVPALKAALIATVAFTLACSDGSGPGDLAGRYRLERYEGSPLPAVRFQSSDGTTLVVSEQIVLDEDGEGLRFNTGRTVDAAHPQGDDYSYTQALTYQVRNGQIAITFICPPNADCIAGPHLVGERVAGGIALAPPTSSKPASIYKQID
jgi:hypothetical protein